jgi:hypothetical protein
MKKHASLYWVSLVSLATAVVSIGVPWNFAMADGTISNSAPATVAAPLAAPPLAFGVSEVVKMYQGGINKDVLLGYIENTALPFHLDADGIIYLQRLGMPQDVTSALIRRDGDLQKQAAAAYQQQSLAIQQQEQATSAAAANNQAAAGNTGSPVVMPSTPPPVAPYTYPDAAPPVAYPDYSGYPYYGYPYYYGPGVVIGGGWGWGWGGGGWGRGGFGHGGFGGRGGFSGGFGGGHGGGGHR